jgi:hypothetical protein
LLLAGYVASGKALEELDDEQIYEIAKSEIVARYSDLADERLRAVKVHRSRSTDQNGEVLRRSVDVTYAVSGSERPLELNVPFLTCTTWEAVRVKMSEQGDGSPNPHVVVRETRTKIVPDGEQEAARLEASKEAGYKGQFITPTWRSAPISIALDHYEGVSGRTVVRDPSVPAVLLDAEAEGGLTEAEFLELIEKLLKEQGIHLVRSENAHDPRGLPAAGTMTAGDNKIMVLIPSGVGNKT